MTSEFFTLNLSDLEPLFFKSHCACHIINPNKTRIILWKSQADPNAYYLRIGIQKFISYPLKDKNKALYWWFKTPEIKVEEKERVHSELSQVQKTEETITNPDPNNPVTKYQQRLEKTVEINNHANNSNSNSS